MVTKIDGNQVQKWQAFRDEANKDGGLTKWHEAMDPKREMVKKAMVGLLGDYLAG